LVPIEGQSQDVRVWGVIGKPRSARANRSGQLFFVNNRWIKSMGLSYALAGGYHGLLMQDRYAVAAVFVDCDLKRVDVNVHPTKQEVSISNEAQIKSFLKDLVEKRLAAEPDLAPSMRSMPSSEERAWTGHFQKPLPQSWGSSTLGEGLPGVAQGELHVRSVAAEPLEKPIAVKNKFHITKILGQIHHTFILAETEEGMMIVDQHAAHERVRFEGLTKAWASGEPVRQKLLMEEVLELPAKQAEILGESLDFFGRLGFEIEEFGNRSFVVRAVPPAFGDQHAAAVIRHYLEEKEEGRLRTGLENRQEDIAALVACKRQSVKAHDAMTADAMRALLEQLAGCDNPFNCPHGRPSFLKYSFSDLEKQFKRKL
ncbi:MAG: hypothetical protein WC352_03475, partial [Candidatus Omnitrophota bacterium]